MRRLVLVVFLISISFNYYADIVINELFYDSVGSDEGNEWIELYNNSNEDVNLQGWILQAAGPSFTDILIFPSIIIRSKSFFLISEQASTLTNLVADLTFQNGGSASDGVRIVNPRNQYKDTILYDNPNSNNLLGDTDFQQPCTGVEPGQSLARIYDGVDSNSCDDWMTAFSPSPGTSNAIVKIVSIVSSTALALGEEIEVSTIILNLSTYQVDKSELSIKISFNNYLKYQGDLLAIPSQDSLMHCVSIENESLLPGLVLVELINNSNVEIVDNLWESYISYTIPQIRLSEIMHSPLTGNSEWVEIKLLETLNDTKVILRDAAGNYASSLVRGLAGEYIVIAEDKKQIINTFPACDSSLVVQAEGWTRLNNNGDSLIIESYNTLLDSLQYGSNSTRVGFSLEYQSDSEEWLECCSIERATPTKENSSTYQDDNSNKVGIHIINNLISRSQAKNFKLEYNCEKEVSFLTMKIFDIRGKILASLSNEIRNQYFGDFSWNGYLKGKYLASGLYPTVISLSSESGRVLIERKTLITINR